MLYITARTVHESDTELAATRYKGTYTAHEDDEGEADHTYEMDEVNGIIVRLIVDGENLTGQSDWEDTIWDVIRGKEFSAAPD